MARRAGRVASVTAEKAKGYAGDAYGAAKGYASNVRADAKDIPDIARIARTDPRVAGGLLLGNRAAQLGAGALGAAGLAGGGYALAREKQAALNGLVDAGMDFDTAAALVEETSQELYGA